MAYLDIYAAATDEASSLRGQVAVAVTHAATDIINEDSGTENHVARYRWARRVTLDNTAPLTEAINMLWKVLENAGIQASPTTSTDSVVQTQVNALINTFAAR